MFEWVKVFAAVAVAVALTGAASGGECQPEYKKVVTIKTVTFTKVVEVPYQKTVIRYDHCGCPYTVTVTGSKEVEVTYTKQVPGVQYVKVVY